MMRLFETQWLEDGILLKKPPANQGEGEDQ